MARLILLNGAPGCGKSTLAQRFVADHPLAADLDVDRIRALIGGWQAHRIEAGLLARAMVLAMARTHLGGGHDVIVPQFLGRLAFVEQLADLADEVSVPFVEVALVADLDEARRRFDARTAAAADPAHVDAGADAAHDGFDTLYERLLGVLRERPGTRFVHTTTGDIEGSYAALLDALSRP